MNIVISIQRAKWSPRTGTECARASGYAWPGSTSVGRQLGTMIFITYLVPQTLLFIPLAQIIRNFQLGDTPWSLILTYPTFLIPFLYMADDGYFKAIPRNWRNARASTAPRVGRRWSTSSFPVRCPASCQPASSPSTLSWNEFIYALVFLSSPDQKTVPVGVTSELIRGDVFFWGPLMAGALLARSR